MKWYGNLRTWKGQKGKVQVSLGLRRDEDLELPEPVLRLAQAEYDLQYPGQPYEQMQKRGGLGLLEVVALLADALERKSAS